VLERAGADGRAVVHVITVLDCLVLGSALDAGAPVEVWADGGEATPAMGRALGAVRDQEGDRSEEAFELGLAAVLSGIGTALGLPG